MRPDLSQSDLATGKRLPGLTVYLIAGGVLDGLPT